MKKSVIIILILLVGVSCNSDKSINDFYSEKAIILDQYYNDSNKINYKNKLKELSIKLPKFKHKSYLALSRVYSENDSIIYFLNKSITSGFYNSFQIEDYFENKIDTIILKELIIKADTVRKRHFEKMKYPQIAQELYKMYVEDQKVRENYIENVKPKYSRDSKEYKLALRQILKTDSINSIKLDSILGILNAWPKISDFDEQVSSFAFYFFQHSDISFQKKYFSQIDKYAKDNELIRKNYAYMKDRFLINNDKKQLFGTQFEYNDDKTYTNYPIDNYLLLDSLRFSHGLISMKSHMKSINKNGNRKFIFLLLE